MYYTSIKFLIVGRREPIVIDEYPVAGMLKFGSEASENLALRTWHYPIINDSDRPYQQRIIESALMKNTLVCLPTGLGKTFIGLVVTYNFHRWFPDRKILFMAPTRPLVNQQFKAFNQMYSKQLNIKSIEVTGSMGPEKRHEAWSSHHIFFTTPQVLENDLMNDIIKKDSIVCLIIDEAHKAVGSYSYCSIVKMLHNSNVWFRVCALTATPGSTVSSIQTLINNLKIEKLEYLNEFSEEIKPYTLQRAREVITIPADPLIETVKFALDDIIRKIYLYPLQKSGISFGNDIDGINIAAFPTHKNFGAVEGYLAGLRVLLHIRDLLVFYGINSMLAYLKSLESGQATPLKSRIKKQITDSEQFQRVILDLQTKSSSSHFLSHPKLRILSETLREHFSQADPNFPTKAMIFSNYRESVFEICDYLQKFYPSMRPAPLLGHSTSSDAQKHRKLNQQSTIENFIQDTYNILVTTCIGEEGLDIGYVDLIVFYDAHSSPIRLVQRSGRTGRKRDGTIVVLVNEKKEKSMLDHSETASRIIDNAMRNSDRHFSFEKIEPNHFFNVDSSFQIVKFKLNISSTQEKVCRKRNLSYVPRTLPSVPQLDMNNSMINNATFHGKIGHSISTDALIKIVSLFGRKETNNTKCLSIWRSGLKSMPIFKPFNYQANSLSDYKFFYEIINKDSDGIEAENELPDEFFDSDDLDFKSSFVNELSSGDVNNFDKSFDDQFLDFNFNESDLDEFNWSDHNF